MPGQPIRSAELGAIPLLFRETFRDRASVEKGGATLVGTGTTFNDGLVLNGSGNLRYAISASNVLRAAGSLRLDVTIPDPAAGVYLIDFGTAAVAELFWVRLAGGNLQIALFGVLVLNVAAPEAGRRKIILSWASGATTTWVDGVSQGTSAAAFTYNAALTKMAIGSRADDLVRFVGTIHSLEIYGAAASAVDEPYLRNGNLISKLDEPLVVLPGTSFYKRASDSKYVTEVKGKAGITEALMGSDGTTTTQFPSIIRPRGFSFDGGDQINLGDNDQFSFTGGSPDLPFSVALLAQVDDFSAVRALVTKAASLTAGEWALYVTTAGYLRFISIDESATAYRGRTATTIAMKKGILHAVVATYSGSGLVSGFKIFLDGVQVDGDNLSSGVYVAMENTATAALVGAGLATGSVASPLNGRAALPCIFDFELSPFQAKALTARLKRLARTP